MGWLRRLPSIVRAPVQRADLATRAFASTGQWVRAVAWGRVAVRENPMSARAWNDLGLALSALAGSDDPGCHGAQELWQEAADAFQHALSLDPSFPDARNNLSIALAGHDSVA